MFADKSNFLQSKVLRSNLALFFIIAMVAGFFVSRAVLSISMILFGLNALIDVHPRRWLREKWWLLGVGWIALYAISWFWSNDYAYWNTRLQVKLPILLLPLAFAFTPAFNYLQQKLFTIALCLLLLIAAGYSMFFFVSDPEAYIQGYIFSHVLPTIPKNDHIRTSLAAAAGVTWMVYFYPQLRTTMMKWFVAVTIVILSIYLHVLAARTGLAAWYIFIACYTIYLALRKKTRALGVTLILFFCLAAAAAFTYIPTLRERVGYFRYTLIVLENEGLTGDYSDMGRFMSYDIGQKLIREHPAKGVGAGNILDTMKKGYDRWYPQVKEEQRLIPHNQFLTVGVACGIPALLLFAAWVFYPLFQVRRNRAGFFFTVVWCMMLVPLMVEPVLEIQFGVFVYLFFLLWQRHAMVHSAAEE
jgi:hypothetical protein